MTTPRLRILSRDVLALTVLYVASAWAIREAFGTNEVIRFPWLVVGPTVFLMIVRGYGVLWARVARS